MDGTETLLGILLGAILGGGGKIFFDQYQRIQERKSVAAALAGEISGILHNAQVKGLRPWRESSPGCSVYGRLLEITWRPALLLDKA
jgi:hypothetical protein